MNLIDISAYAHENGVIMDLEGGLRSLGLEQCEAAFRQYGPGEF
jgi:hypothetical protein